jgi:hypothetical protein
VTPSRAPPPTPFDVSSPSYKSSHLAPGSNFRELDLPNLATAPARLHPGIFWLEYHLLCALSAATDHRLGIDSRLFVPHPDGHLPEAPPFHHGNLSGAFPPTTLELILGLHVDCSRLPVRLLFCSADEPHDASFPTRIVQNTIRLILNDQLA